MGVILTLIAALAIALVVARIVKGFFGSKQRAFPPGPPPNFLVGNALDLPAENAHRVYADWAKKYNSDILHASVFGNHVVIVNSLKVADDLFEKRAHLYSDRPNLAISRMIDIDYVVALYPHGELWRKHRKAAHQLLYSTSAEKYQPIQQQEVRTYLRNLLYRPEDYEKHSKMLSISIPLLLSFGYKPDSIEDPIIDISDEVAIGGLTLTMSLINFFPLLRHIPAWFPGAKSSKLAERVNKLTVEMKRIPIDRAKIDCIEGRAKSSIMTNFYDKYGTRDFPEEEETMLKNISYTIYTGAADTTISSTGSLLYAMAANPAVQKKAQDELDTVLGYGNRLPEFSDRPSLPYVEAIYRELLRAYPPLPLGLPHSLSEDDIYDGYFLPKGTTIFGNIWAINHDERVFPEPFAFKPERFINADGTLNDESRIMAYGFGRRVCVGKAVASNTMWLVIASFLACFNIGPTKNKSGEEIKIDGSYIEHGIAQHKKPFKCTIAPRSEQHKVLIETTVD